MRIVCVGGGPAGLYFAILMKKRDPSHAVTVIERNRPGDTFGWGVVFSDETLRNLHGGDAESLAEIEANFAHWDDIDVHFRGRVIRSGGHGFCGIARKRLLGILQARAAALGVELRFETELRDLDAIRPADLIVAADGVGSSVRDSLGIPTERKSFSDGVLRLLVDRLDEMRGGDWENVIDFWAAPEKSLRILYTPCSVSDVYLSMMSPVTHPVATTVPVNKDIWSDAVPELAPLIRTIGTQGRFNAYEMTRARDWSMGKAALVGDSAHAMPPTLGQGVGCAMMNALALAALLSETDNIEQGLSIWEKNERPMTDATQDESCNIAETRRLQEGQTINASDHTFSTAKHVPTGTHGGVA
ncbi:MAG: FAD-dependent monooxygenase [Acetobacteraceae bacterium]